MFWLTQPYSALRPRRLQEKLQTFLWVFPLIHITAEKHQCWNMIYLVTTSCSADYYSSYSFKTDISYYFLLQPPKNFSFNILHTLVTPTIPVKHFFTKFNKNIDLLNVKWRPWDSAEALGLYRNTLTND